MNVCPLRAMVRGQPASVVARVELFSGAVACAEATENMGADAPRTNTSEILINESLLIIISPFDRL